MASPLEKTTVAASRGGQRGSAQDGALPFAPPKRATTKWAQLDAGHDDCPERFNAEPQDPGGRVRCGSSCGHGCVAPIRPVIPVMVLQPVPTMTACL